MFRLFAGILVLGGVLTGCAAGPNLAKVTFSRTTIPAASAGGASGSAVASGNTTGFDLASLRQIDPCGLLDANMTAGLGTAQDGSAADGFDFCTENLTDPNGHDLDLSITLGEAFDDNPTLTLDGLPVAQQASGDTSDCYNRIITQSDPQLGIVVEADDKSDACHYGQLLAQAVINRIRTNPPKRNNTGSLAALDPCAMVDDATVAAAVGAGADKSYEDLYKCDWQGGQTDLSVEFTVGEDPKTDNSLGNPTPVTVAGITAYQVYSTDVFPSCTISWLTRSTGDGSGEIVHVEFDNVQNITVDVCAKAVAVATVVGPKVPKNS